MDVVEVVLRNSNGLIRRTQVNISSGAPRRGSHGLYHQVLPTSSYAPTDNQAAMHTLSVSPPDDQ
ncbi:hypothetical protein A2U01_0067723, partial [Trifolium medium]|nr:hypothetical protein [Trifolium medium]